MLSINGLLKQTLEGEGFTGSINNALYNKLVDLTGVDNLQLDGLWKVFLEGQGYSGSNSGMLFRYLGDKGYTGSLPKRFYDALLAGDLFAFDPLSLFANGEQGAWYDPSDLTTLYQDSAGTIPVTADGDPVGLMLDKSGNGNHATQATSGAKPLYRTDGTLHWLEFDGVDDFMDAPNDIITGQSAWTLVMAGRGQADTGAGWANIEGSVGGADAVVATFEPGIRTGGGFAAWAPSIAGADTVYRMQHPGSGTIGDTRCFVDSVERSISSSSGLATSLNLGGSTTTRLYGLAVPISGLFYGGIVLAREFADQEGTDTDAYLATKSGVTL